MFELATGTTLWQQLDGRDTARMSRYRKYLAFYEGDQWDERRRAGERRLTVNYARALVRKSASYLMPRPVTFDVPHPLAPSPTAARGEGEPNTEPKGKQVLLYSPLPRAASGRGAGGEGRVAETALAEVYLALDLHTLDFQSAVDSAVLGDGAFKVTWNGAERRPVVAAVDPHGLWAWWRADDPSVMTRVVQRYELERDEVWEVFGGTRDQGLGISGELKKLPPPSPSFEF